MKKKIISLLLVLSAFLITSGVSAKEMSKDDIKPGTYMIGTHLFTRVTAGEYDGTLTVRYIMLAARTINSANIDDMIIYLKNSRGKWVNAVTNEEVTVPNKVDIYYENSVEEFLPKTEIDSGLDITSAQWLFYPLFDERTVAETTSGNIKEYQFELYEKTSSGYTFIDSNTVNPRVGAPLAADATNEVKTYVCRLAITNSKGEKIYSNYSEELTLSLKDSIPAPEISYECDMSGCSVNVSDYYFRTSCNNSSSCSSTVADKLIGNYYYNVYEKNGNKIDNGYTLGARGKTASITDISNEEKTYVAKLYLTNSKGEEVVSKESNEITISAKDILGKPELKYGCTGASCSIWINYNTELANEVNYVVYEKTNESYTEVGTAISNGGEAGTAVSITLTNEPKTYVTRFYITNSAGEKLYSDYSDEVIINAKDILGKPELTYSYDSNNSNILFETILGAEYVTEAENAFDYDIELYTKNNDSYNLVDTKTYNTATGRGTIDIAVPSSATTYVVRVVVTNSASEKIYSDYSYEVTVTIDNA